MITYNRFYAIHANSYDWFKPAKSIMHQVNDKTKDFNKNTIGIHIRKNDHILWKSIDIDKKVYRIISSTLEKKPNSTFFLATDCIETKQKFKKNFGNVILTNSIESYNRNSSAGIIDGVIDLLCLSKTQKIYGPYYSGYSQVAAAIGKIKLEVIL